MDLELSEEQKMLQKAARNLLNIECSKKLVREMEDDATGHPLRLWEKMTEVGWQGFVLPEKYGGGGGRFIDLAVLIEEMGRACLPGPFISSTLCALTILDLGTEEQQNRILPQIVSGETIMTTTANNSNTMCDPTLMASAIGKDEYVINGTSLFVPYAHVSDWIICSATTNDGAKATDRITLFLISGKDAGIKCQQLATVANDRQFKVEFNEVRVSSSAILGEVHKGYEGARRMIQRAAIIKCIEMAGAAQQVLEMTVNYAKDRKQFNHPIGSYQAIQHYCANMTVDTDAARFIAYKAAWLLSEGLPFATEASMAKAWVNEACRRVMHIGHQIHAAIGFTWDSDMQLYSRRTIAAKHSFGDTDFHREIVAQSL